MVFPIQTTFSSSTSSSSSLPTAPSAQWLPSFAGHVAPTRSRATADAAVSAVAAASAALNADRTIKHTRELQDSSGEAPEMTQDGPEMVPVQP